MSNRVKGVAPGFLLIPAREYSWELVTRVQIRVPNEGSIKSLVGDKAFAEGVTFPGDDEFCLFDDNALLLWEIVRVLFAGAQYPQLKDNECLNVVAIDLPRTETDDLVLHGEIVRHVDG